MDFLVLGEFGLDTFSKLLPLELVFSLRNSPGTALGGLSNHLELDETYFGLCEFFIFLL